ncbi:MAG: histidinol-phosphate transaminase [Deltaproteobacteria bacterium]|nr:histidinol-phosphate transaminase [Deltaproteobacteria bacterium]
MSTFESLVSPQILHLDSYVPGKPVEELRREKGLARIVKLASNENSLGPSPVALEAYRLEGERLYRYPDGYGFCLKEALSERFGVAPENLVLGNGSSEIIEMTVRLLVQPGKTVVLASPSFSIYEIVVQAQGGEAVRVPLRDHRIDLDGILRSVGPETALVILGNPNNPTGTTFGRSEWEDFLARVPARVGVLLDEAYAEYAEDESFPDGREYLAEDRLLVVARTFSKAYGLAGLRIGYGFAPREIVDYMNRLRLPFNANGPAQAAAAASLRDREHRARPRAVNREGLARLYRLFEEYRVPYVPSQANFVLARVGDGDALFKSLLEEGVIVRSTRAFGMPEWIRVTSGLPEEIEAFEEAFRRVYPRLAAA